MPMQVRPKEGGNWYSPGRDIVYAFPHLLRQVAMGLTEEFFKDERWLYDFAQKNNISQDEIGAAMIAFVEIIKYGYDPNFKDPKDALEKSGWFALPSATQLLVSAKLGQILTGVYWYGLKQVLSMDDPPDEKIISHVMEAATDLAKVMQDHALVADPAG